MLEPKNQETIPRVNFTSITPKSKMPEQQNNRHFPSTSLAVVPVGISTSKPEILNAPGTFPSDFKSQSEVQVAIRSSSRLAMLDGGPILEPTVRGNRKIPEEKTYRANSASICAGSSSIQ